MTLRSSARPSIRCCTDQGNLKPKYRLGRKGIKSSSGKKDLRVFVDKKLNMSQQCVLTCQKAKYILGCTKRAMTSKIKVVILPLYTAFVKPFQEYCVQLCGPKHKEDATYWNKSRRELLI